MPFVEQSHRGNAHVPCCVGDLCFKEYKTLIEAWTKEPRWTTAHNEFKRLFDVSDEQAAKTLAYLVFFNKIVMEYEREKCQINGDIK